LWSRWTTVSVHRRWSTIRGMSVARVARAGRSPRAWSSLGTSWRARPKAWALSRITRTAPTRRTWIHGAGRSRTRRSSVGSWIAGGRPLCRVRSRASWRCFFTRRRSRWTSAGGRLGTGASRCSAVHAAWWWHRCPTWPGGAPGVAMWVGNSLHWQGWRQGVLYGAGGCRRVGAQDDRVRPGALHLLRPHHHPGTLGGHGAWVRTGPRGRPIPRAHTLLVLLVGL